ncbi:hypothetical protein DXG01_004457 [Tephrocybe rancida]|nr:hypothetical protein DXG01_004457 [Tephrocybe rancida]
MPLAIFQAFIIGKVPENMASEQNVTLGASVMFILTVIVASTVQGFYAWRVRRLSKGRPLMKFIVAFIIVTGIAQFACGLGRAIATYIDSSLDSSRNGISEDAFWDAKLRQRRQPPNTLQVKFYQLLACRNVAKKYCIASILGSLRPPLRHAA